MSQHFMSRARSRLNLDSDELVINHYRTKFGEELRDKRILKLLKRAKSSGEPLIDPDILEKHQAFGQTFSATDNLPAISATGMIGPVPHTYRPAHTRPITQRVMGNVYPVLWNLRPAQVYEDSMKSIAVYWGDLLGDQLPATHITKNVAYEAARAASYISHTDLLHNLREKRFKIYDEMGNVRLIQIPFCWHTDGFSAGLNAWEVWMVKHFGDTKRPLYTRHSLFRIASTHAKYQPQTPNMREVADQLERDGTGNGLFLSFLWGIENTCFTTTEVKGSIEEPLGIDGVCGGSVGFVADNGPGMLKGPESLSKRMTALLKFVCDTFWDDAHHFQCTTKHLRDRFPEFAECPDMVQCLVAFMRSPKRSAFVDKFQEKTSLELSLPSAVGPTRWVPGTRAQMEQFDKDLGTWRLLLEHIRDEPKDFWQSTDQQETMHLQKVKGYSRRLEDHDFLWNFFYWLDVLDVESYVIKLNSGSNSSLLTSHKTRVKLHEFGPKLMRLETCPTLLRYLDSVTFDGRTGEASTTIFGGDGELINNFQSYGKGISNMEKDIKKIGGSFLEEIKKEFPINAEHVAYDLVFSREAWDWNRIKNDPTYFSSQAKTLLERFPVFFGDDFQWISDAAPAQLRVLQEFLAANATFVRQRKKADHQTFWADLWDRMVADGNNVSIVQYLYYSCEARGTACVPVEEFNKNLSRVWRQDKHRAHTSTDYGEDIVRIRQNMPPPFFKDADGNVCGLDLVRLADVWETQFQHQSVRTQLEVKRANEKWQGSSDQADSNRYKRKNADEINRKNRERRQSKKVAKDNARGLYNPGLGKYTKTSGSVRHEPLTLNDDDDDDNYDDDYDDDECADDRTEVVAGLVAAVAVSQDMRAAKRADAAAKRARQAKEALKDADKAKKQKKKAVSKRNKK